jgi:hypothetical protein
VKIGKYANDTCAMLSEAYEREDVKRSRIFDSHKLFKEGRENVKDEEDNVQGCCSL